MEEGISADINPDKGLNKLGNRLLKKLDSLSERFFYPRNVQVDFMGENIIFSAQNKRHEYNLLSLGGEREIMQESLSLLNPGDTFWDIGAEVGKWSLFASRRVGKTGRVVSLEPYPYFYDLLKVNLGLNGCANVIAIPKAAWSSNEKIALFTNVNNKSPRSAEINSKSPNPVKLDKRKEVTASRLDDLIRNEKLGTPKMIKVDTEGSGAHVLAGLGDVRPEYIVYELHKAFAEELPAILTSDYSLVGGIDRRNESIQIYRRIENN